MARSRDTPAVRQFQRDAAAEPLRGYVLRRHLAGELLRTGVCLHREPEAAFPGGQNLHIHVRKVASAVRPSLAISLKRPGMEQAGTLLRAARGARRFRRLPADW